MAADTYIQFLLALVVVLALIAALAWLARRFGFAPAAAVGRGGRRRLSIVETAPLDGKRRLMLVARDGVEHLVLLGANSETVIETGIAAGRGGQAQAQTRPPAAAGAAPEGTPGKAESGRA